MFKNDIEMHILHRSVEFYPKRENNGEEETMERSIAILRSLSVLIGTVVICLTKRAKHGGHRQNFISTLLEGIPI